jgi:hypothetical protein
VAGNGFESGNVLPAHAWTIEALKVYYDQRLVDLQSSLDQRFGDADKAVNAALQAAEKAVTKAELAAEKRFDANNEFREQLRDQAATFMPRTENELQIASLNAGQVLTASRLDKMEGSDTSGQRFLGVGISILAILVSLGSVIAILVHG